MLRDGPRQTGAAAPFRRLHVARRLQPRGRRSPERLALQRFTALRGIAEAAAYSDAFLEREGSRRADAARLTGSRRQVVAGNVTWRLAPPPGALPTTTLPL
jgi:hypothetical protein